MNPEETADLNLAFLDDQTKEMIDLALREQQQAWTDAGQLQTNQGMMDFLQLGPSPPRETESPFATPSSAFQHLNLSDASNLVLPEGNLTQEQLIGVLSQLLGPSPSHSGAHSSQLLSSGHVSPGSMVSNGTQISPGLSTHSPPSFNSPMITPIPQYSSLPSPRKRDSVGTISIPAPDESIKRKKVMRPASPVESVKVRHSPKMDTPQGKPLVSSPLGHPMTPASPNMPNLLPPIFGPLTPATLMKLDRPSVEQASSMPRPIARSKSRQVRTSSVGMSRTVNALVSPHLKPLLPAAPLESTLGLASKSNYQHLKDRTDVLEVLQLPAEMPQSTGQEKRSQAKKTDQMRRELLKHGFTQLKDILPFDQSMDRNPSKAIILRRGITFLFV
jgi:hypothetical protein